MNKDQIQAIIEQKQSVIDEAKQLIKEQEEAMRVLKAEIVAQPVNNTIKTLHSERCEFYKQKGYSDKDSRGYAFTDALLTYCEKNNKPYGKQAYDDVLALISEN